MNFAPFQIPGNNTPQTGEACPAQRQSPVMPQTGRTHLDNFPARWMDSVRSSIDNMLQRIDHRAPDHILCLLPLSAPVRPGHGGRADLVCGVAAGGQHAVPGEEDDVAAAVRRNRLAAPLAVVRPLQLKGFLNSSFRYAMKSRELYPARRDSILPLGSP